MKYKLTSVKLLEDLYKKFKYSALSDEFTLQKLVNHSSRVEAVLVPEWFNGVDCKSIVHRFESCPALKFK